MGVRLRRGRADRVGVCLPWTATDGIAAHCGRIRSRERLVASDRLAFGVPGPETVIRPRRPAGRVLPPLAAPHLRAVSLRGGRSVPPGPGFRLTPLRTQGNPPGERLPWTATDGIAAHCGRIRSRERVVASDRVAFGVPGPESVIRPRRSVGPVLPPLAAPHLRTVSLRGGRNVPPGPGFRLPALRTQGNRPSARAPVGPHQGCGEDGVEMPSGKGSRRQVSAAYR